MQMTSLKGAHLSLQQRRLWSFQREDQVYYALCTIKIQGELHPVALLHGLQNVVKQHEILHTTFRSLPNMSVPMQIIGNPGMPPYSIVNLENLDDVDQAIQLDACFTLLQEKSCEVLSGPAISVLLVRMSSDVHVLSLGLPALCADFPALKYLVAEIFNASISRQEDNDPGAESLQYVDVSAWQNKLLELEDAEEQQAFWHKFDLSLLTIPLFPFEQKEAEPGKRLEISRPSALQRLTLPLETTTQNQIQVFCQEAGISAEVFLLACWLLLLWRLNGVSAYPIGVACDGRYYEELETAIGLYTRIVPFAVPVTENLPFFHLISLVDTLLKETQQRQMSFTWEQFVTPESSLAFLPVCFEFESWPANLSHGELTFSLIKRSCCIEPFFLKLNALQVGEELFLEVQFDPACLSSVRAGRLADMLHALLQEASSQPHTRVGVLPILHHTEQQSLLHAFMGQQKPVPFRTLQQSFEAQVDCRPAQAAVVCGPESLTYQQLNIQANQLAHLLRCKGVGPNVLVGLCVERSINMLVGLLAILKAGGTYVPLDPEQPVARLAYQLRDLSASPLLLTQKRFLPRFEGWESPLLCLDDREVLAGELTCNLECLNALPDLAYVIYTSGSTGIPKGVMISHQAVNNYTRSLCELLAPEPGLQFATVSTLSADLGNTAIFCALASGGCLHVIPYETATSGRAFASYLADHPIDVLKIVPSHLSALLSSGLGKQLLPRRHLVLGGEALPGGLLASLQESGGNCCVINHYGPTETTIGALINVLGVLEAGEDRAGKGAVPIGRPIANVEAYILDRNRQVVPLGVTGGLYLAGAGLATGYLNLPEQTAERFVPNPFEKAGGRMYQTGDLACYREDGLIEFVGRQDNQVKLHGFRIELEEIEAALNRHTGVQESAVVLIEDRSGGPQLVAYIVAKQPRPTAGDLRNFLEDRLPRQMVPSSFSFLHAFPLTSNGKVDRQLLSHIQGREDQTLLALLDQSEGKVLVQPRDEVEFQLLNIWEELLNVSPISILDNFFDLGGHSILAVRLMSLIHKQFGQELALTALFNAPTIEKLALLLRQRTSQRSSESVLVKLAEGSRVPFFCIHPAGSYVFCYTDLARYLGPDQPFYGLQTPLVREHYGNVEDMAMHYILAIQAVQPQGPYFLGGWSLGGVIAFEIALQLQRQGQEVALLSIMDSDAPALHSSPHSFLNKPDIDDETLARDVLTAFELAAPGKDFEILEPEKQLEYACEQAKLAHILPADVDLHLLRRIMIMRKMNIYAARRYEPQQAYPGRITLFRATESLKDTQSAEVASDADITRGWEKLATNGVEVHLVSGKHRQLMEEPAVQALATMLKQCIADACNRYK